MSLFKRRRVAFERETIRIAHEVLGDEVPVEQHPEIDAIVIDEVQLNLTALRDRYRDLGPEEAQVWLQNALTELLVIDEAPDLANEETAILPALHARSFLEAHRLAALHRDSPHQPLAVRQITDGVFVGLMWDRTHSMVTLPESVLEQWGRSYEEVYATALENLSALPMVGWAGSDDRVFRLIAGDDYVSARLLTRDAFDRLPFTGDVVVCAPTKADLFVAAVDDPQSLVDILEASVRASRAGSVLSLRPLRLGGGTWSHLHLEPDHPAYLPWRMLTRLDWAHEADRTRSLLQALVGTGVFVGSLIVREDEATGITDTVSVWSEGVPALLATADLVSFPRTDRDAGFVTAPWSRVVDVLSDQMTKTDHYPERWLIESFPTDDQLAELAAPGRSIR